MIIFERVFCSIYGECWQEDRTLSCKDAASHKLRFQNILMILDSEVNARAVKGGGGGGGGSNGMSMTN